MRNQSLATAMAAAMSGVLLATTAIMGSGCGKSKTVAPIAPAVAANAPVLVPLAPSHVAGTPHTNKIIHGLKNAGLRPEGFNNADPARYGASFCENGRVNDLETLVCEFPDGNSLARGKQLLADEWGRQGVATGVTAQKGETLMAIADREHRDPNGKTINQIVSAFKKL
ncbi:MAG TPA: hypothetical protein VFH73_02670 [Polyangia bacterium]|jgi:hypothetical protein|nr:hypothetical protein [Polyangia bacterium]